MSATIPVEATDHTAPVSDPIARAFSVSMMVSGVRCTLAYIVFPWLLPILGVTGGVGPLLGAAIGGVAIGFNVASIRRFWLSRHRYRAAVITINVLVIGLLAVLLVEDLVELLT